MNATTWSALAASSQILKALQMIARAKDFFCLKGLLALDFLQPRHFWRGFFYATVRRRFFLAFRISFPSSQCFRACSSIPFGIPAGPCGFGASEMGTTLLFRTMTIAGNPVPQKAALSGDTGKGQIVSMVKRFR